MKFNTLYKALLTGEDGKVSWTKVLVGHALLLFWTVYIQVFMLHYEYTAPILSYVLEIMILFVAPRPFQMGLGRLGSGIGAVKANVNESFKKQKKEKEKSVSSSQPKANVKYTKPCAGSLTSEFRTPKRPKHHGIDIAAKGKIPIHSIADGVVVRSYTSNTYGETVIIQHGEVQSLYAHMAKNSKIKTGAKVKQGEQIGLMGNTGRSRGQHLHFEIHLGAWNSRKSNAVDPLSLIKI